MPGWQVIRLTGIEAGGNFVTVTSAPPRLNKIGSQYALTCIREEGPPDGHAGSFQAVRSNPICASS
jgi:hypothetical protein